MIFPHRKSPAASAFSKPVRYTNLLTSGRLHEHVAEVDCQMTEQFELIVRQTADRQGVTEQAKEKNPMEWVRKMNEIHSAAEEAVLHDMEGF